MLVSGSISSFSNGVSQQATSLRLPSQGEEQVNAYSSLVEGLKRRPPTEHLALVSATPLGNVFVHTINRDADERYVVIISDGDLKVFDFEGDEKTVNFPDGTDYLDSTDPKNSFAAVTVADYTFIVNKGVEVEVDTPVSPPNESSVGTVYVKQAAYSTTYTVYVNGASVASHTVPTSSGADTETIAEALRVAAVAGLGAGWTITRYGSVLKIVKDDGSTFTLHTKDSAGDTFLAGFTDKTQRFSDLPPKGFDGVVVEIIGDASNSFDSYFVEYDKDTNRWIETVKVQHADTLDPATMPHKLVREIDGTFTFEQIDWQGRDAGDRESAPDPSFVGTTINDIFFFRGRLGVLADENVVLSAIGATGYFRFYPATVTTILDGSPIDVAAKNTRVSILKHAVEFDKRLYLFSENAQFVMTGGDILSPSTAEITKVTEFDANPLCVPAIAGKTVVFAVPKGNYTGIREFFIPENTDSEDAADITEVVPSYIAADAFKLIGSSNDDTVFLLTRDAPDTIYVYKYYWQKFDKVQSSWSRWTMPATSVLNADMIDNELYVVLERDEGVTLEKMDLQANRADTGLGYLVHLDRRTSVTGVYDAGNGWTTWTLPYEVPTDEEVRVVRGADFGSNVGARVSSVTRPSTTTVRATGNYSTGECFLGVPYTRTYRLSTIQYRVAQQRGFESIQSGRLQLKRLKFVFDNTGYFKVTVASPGRDTYEYVYAGRTIGNENNIIGAPAINSGDFTVPIGAVNKEAVITIEDDSHLPSAFLSAEWEGFFTLRSRRL